MSEQEFQTLTADEHHHAVSKRREDRKNSRRSARNMPTNDVLNINSLMDIMTILLVYLLINITSDSLFVKQQKELILTKSESIEEPIPSIPITIYSDKIVVDKKEVVVINNLKIDAAYKQGSDSSFLIQPLKERLEKLVQVQKDQDARLGREWKPVCTIIAHREIPYRIITEVVYTAGQAKLMEFKFAVISTGHR